MAHLHSNGTTVSTSGDTGETDVGAEGVNKTLAEKSRPNWEIGTCRPNPAYDLLSPPASANRNNASVTPHLVSAGPHRDQFFSSGKPANSHRGKLIPTRRRNPCDICGDTTGACREERNGDRRLCATQGDSLRKSEVVLGANGSNWRFSRKDQGLGRWGVFYPDRGDSRPVQRRMPLPKTKPAVTRLPVEQRSPAYRLLLERQSLHVEDAEDLFRRGFNADQINTMGVKTLKSGLRFKEAPIGLPGFSCGTYIGDTGYFIPTFDWDGQITGGQVRPRGGKYKWLPQCHVEGDELPLQILKGDAKKPVFFAESVGAKVWKGHFDTGATFIGAAGGNFASSPRQLQSVLGHTKDQDRILLPDGDSIYNPDVLSSYQRLYELVPDLKVRWWDQFFKGSDLDETERWVDGIDIPFTDWIEKTSRLRAEGWSFHFDREPDLRLDQRYLNRDLLVKHQSKLDVVVSGLGTGKTEALKAMVADTDEPVLVISRNRKTVRQICERIGIPYVEEGRTDDIDDRRLTGTWMRSQGFGTCSASIRPTSALRFTPDDYVGCTVVLDEWDATASDAVLNQQTDIAQHRCSVMLSLSLLLETAGRVIALSGTMRQMDIDLLEKLTSQRAFVVQNDFKPAQGRDLTIYTREGLLRSHVFNQLKRGKNLLVHTSDQKKSKWSARRMQQSTLAMTNLKEDDTDFFDGQSTSHGTRRQKQLPINPNATLGELKAAYVSPVMAAGVSITLQDHFDQVAIYSGGHLSVADVVQTGARLRTNAPRFMYVPETSGISTFGGNEFWFKLRNDVHSDLRQLTDLVALSLQRGTPLNEDPWFVYGCKLHALQNMQSKHYRHLIQLAYEREGYSVTVIDRELNKVEKKTTQTQSQFVENENERDAARVAVAPMPADASEDQTPQQSADSQQKARIVKVFGLDPNELCSANISDADQALPRLRNRWKFQNPEAHRFDTLQRMERRGGGDPSNLYALDAVHLGKGLLRHEWIRDLLTRAQAMELINRTDWFHNSDAMVQRIHREVLEDPKAKRYIGSKHTNFKSPTSTVKAVLDVIGFDTESKNEKRDGKVVKVHRITDRFEHFNPDQVLKHWTEHPEVLLDLDQIDAEIPVGSGISVKEERNG